MSQGSLQLVQGVYRAFAEANIPSLLSLFSDDMHWYEAESLPYADGNPYVGADQIMTGVFARLQNDWESFWVNPDEFLDMGSTVVVLGHYQGQGRASGAKLTTAFVHVWRVRDDQICEYREFTDTARFLSVLTPQ
ncbi:MAG: nuclear transport factor 2 family protein [Synechococcales cyanobacterium]